MGISELEDFLEALFERDEGNMLHLALGAMRFHIDLFILCEHFMPLFHCRIGSCGVSVNPLVVAEPNP